MALKKGKLTPKEQQFIKDNSKNFSPKQIALHLNRSETVIQDFLKKENISYVGLSEEGENDEELVSRLKSRPYYPELLKQLSPEELNYFVVTWVNLIRQFRGDVLYSEELSIKQWVTMDIMANRTQADKKKTIDQIDRIQSMIDKEYAKPESMRDIAFITQSEQDISMIRGSLSTFTTEYTKITEKIQAITKELKAARTDRIKKVEDSKSSFAGFLNALEDEEIRNKVGEDMEVMRLAKNKVKEKLGQYHKFEDGFIDQPLLTPENVKEEKPNEDN